MILRTLKTNEMDKIEEDQLKMEIQHIFDSGANEIRVLEMVKNYIHTRNAVSKNVCLHNVSTRTFQFSGMKDGEKFVKEIQAPDRESAIADFELTYPDLTWRFSIDIT